MYIIDGKSEITYTGRTAVVIGKFDGIHKGHQKLIREAVSDPSLKSVVFSFTMDSEKYLKDSGRILSREERRLKFESLGVDYLVEYELNEQTMKTEPEDFAREILRTRLHCKRLICGPDLSFGYKGRGNIELLRNLSSELDIEVTVIDKLQYKGEDISSTRIRAAIKEGRRTEAKEML
ncbi:MAG: FAD synthetase family protein [Lachnospiraceae bacterium]|nr:FAD synthetase family protein [Lachnospiraceae bacterium]